jgi:hypothetical protein
LKQYIVAYNSITRQWFRNDSRGIVLSVWSVLWWYKWDKSRACGELALNTSTVALPSIGDDGKGAQCLAV